MTIIQVQTRIHSYHWQAMRKHLFILGLTLSTLTFLSACNLHRNNALTPPAFKYHSDEFKSAGGEKPRDIGYTYSANINDKSLEIWSNIAETLVTQMEEDFHIKKQGIYPAPHARANLFINSYQFALHRELLRRGYTLQDKNADVYHLYYAAKPAKKQESDIFKNVDLTLTLVKDKKILSQTTLNEMLPKFYNNFSTEHDYLLHLRNLEINDTPDKFTEYPAPSQYDLHVERTDSKAKPFYDRDERTANLHGKPERSAPLPINPMPMSKETPYYPPAPNSGPYPPEEYR